MSLSNAFRLLIAKFSLIWKNLLWMVIALSITVGLGYLICHPLIVALSEQEVMGGLTDYISNSSTSSFQQGFTYFVDQVVKLVNIVFSDFASYGLSFILGILLLIIVFGIFSSIRDLATTEVMRAHMTSFSKFGFLGASISKTGVGIVQGLQRVIVTLPFLAIYSAVIYLGYIMIQAGGLAYTLSPFVVILLITLICAFQITIFSCWLPVITMHRIHPSLALGKGFNVVGTTFWRTFSDSIIFVLIAVVINYAFAKFSFCVTLLITIPATIVLGAIFQMVVYFEAQGQRYYIDSQNIVTPKKIEMHDKPQKNKYLI